MSYKIAAAAALASLASTVSAHGYLQNIDISGQAYYGWNNSVAGQNPAPELVAWSDTVTDNGFTSDYTSPDIICHKGAKPGAIAAKVNGGDSVDFVWNTWPESHKGPVITYLAKCDGDCADADKTSLKWFKIDEAGLLSGDSNSGTWASDKLIEAGNSWSVKIPDSIASGNYVARHEIIALHSAGSEGGAQNYPQCVNLEVTSSGSDEPEGTVGTSLYTAQDAGILINIYYPPVSDYKIPGPALYSGASSGSGSSAPASSAKASSAAPATSAAATSAQATSQAASSSAPQVTSNVQVASSAAQTTAAPAATSAAAGSDDVVTATQTDVVTASTAVTVTAGQASATAAISAIASALPSEALTSTISAGIPTATASSGVAKPTKALPEGTTLEDLLSWVEYLFSEYSTKSTTNQRRHARDLLRN